MKRLSTATTKEQDELIEKIREKRAALESAVSNFNDAMETAWANVESAIIEYNETADSVDEWASTVFQEIESFIDAKSEKWQESDKAQPYATWRDEFRINLCRADEIEKPEPISVDFEDDAEMLEQLPLEVGG